MKNIITLSLFVLLFFSISLKAQEKGGVYQDNSAEIQDKINYKVKNEFPVNILHSYTLNIKTDFVRVYSDSSKFYYDRDVTYDMSLKAVDFPKDGKQFIDVMVDSIIYSYKSASKDIYYNSMDRDETPPLKHRDYVTHSIPLGLEWEMVYSPYYEVIDLSGDKLKYKRDYINDEELGIKDEKKLFRWNRGLSDDHLTFIADVHKGMIPNVRVDEDTTWSDFIYFELEGLKFRDSVEVTFKDYTVENYILTAESKKMVPALGKVLIDDINEFGEVIDIEGTGNYKLKVSPYGTVNEFTAIYDVYATVKVNKMVFVQNMKTEIKYSLDGMWEW